jgi:hypothetical protein
MELGTDYTVAYTDNVSAGKATATITGKGNYKGTKSVNFNIVRKAITDEMVTLNPETFTYNGSAQTPTVTVAYKIDEQTTKTLTGDDYDVSYQKVVVGGTPETVTSPTDAGEYNVVVTGKGNYSGTASATFTINAASIAGATIAAIADMTYVGVAIEPELTVTVTLGETQKVLKQGEDYTVEYTNNINVGTATATITGQGNFTGTNSAKFTIVNQTLDVTENDFHNHWMTYYSANGDIDIPESSNIGAYVATSVTGNTVTVTQISYIPEGVAVLLNNETTTTTDKEYNNDQDENLLVHADAAFEVNSDYQEFYGLYEGEFRRVTGTIPAGKNYLRVWEAQAPKLTIVFDDDVNTTGISGATLVNSEEVKGDLYDLQGRKVVYPKKGLYIKNGRKVVVNNK